MNLKFIPLIFIILSLFISGCVEKPAPAATPAATPYVIETPIPAVTIVPATTSAAVPTPPQQPARTPITFRTYVDSDYGFYRVVAPNMTTPYKNNTLTINAGDTVIWINDDQDTRFTIVSEEGLWDKNDTRAILVQEYKEFNYTFPQPGTYNFKLKEYPRKQQKIIVN